MSIKFFDCYKVKWTSDPFELSLAVLKLNLPIYISLYRTLFILFVADKVQENESQYDSLNSVNIFAHHIAFEKKLTEAENSHLKDIHQISVTHSIAKSLDGNLFIKVYSPLSNVYSECFQTAEYQDYSYWDNADRPSEFSAQQWNDRYNLLDSIFSISGEHPANTLNFKIDHEFLYARFPHPCLPEGPLGSDPNFFKDLKHHLYTSKEFKHSHDPK